MRKLGVAAVLAIVLLTICAGCGERLQSEAPSAVRGTIDARHWDFERQGPLKLKGEWAFHWRQLLGPDELPGAGAPLYAALPASWNGIKKDGDALPGRGYATYTLSVLMSDAGTIRSLSIPEAATAYKLWVNGVPIAGNGVVGMSREEYKPETRPTVVRFPVESDEIEIVVQVSNYDHRFGGLWRDIELGLEEHFADRARWKVAVDLLVSGSLAFMGIYHLGLFVYRRKELSLVYFGLSCLLTSLRTLFVGQHYILELFPDLSWTIAARIEYETYYLLVPLSYMFVHSLYPAEMPRTAVRIVQTAGFGFAAYALIAPVYIVSSTNFVFQAVTLLAIIYAAYALYLAVRRGREGSRHILVGSSCVSFSVAWDILYYNEVVPFGDMTSLGLCAIAMTQSFVLASKFSKAFVNVEELSVKLMDLNQNLERTVEERTAEIRRMEMSRRRLLNDISHDLNTPIMLLQGYVEAMSSGIVKEQEQSKYLHMMRARIEGLNRLIHDLFELSKLEGRQISLHFQPITISEFTEHFTSKYEMEIVEHGYAFEAKSSDEVLARSDEELSVDMDRIGQVLTNMVYNALKFTDTEGGSIRFEFDYERLESGAALRMSVIDNGVGIGEADLPHVFDRLFRSEYARKRNKGHTGLGLAIAKEIVEAHRGSIGAESKLGEGSRFWFALPVKSEYESTGS